MYLMRGLVLVLVGLVAFFGIAGADTIYTWYYGKQLASFLQSINGYLSSGDFALLWKIFLGIMVIFVIFSTVLRARDFEDLWRIFVFFFLSIVIWWSISTRVNVNVVDNCTGISYPNIETPIVVGKPLSWFTTIERSVREGLVNFFGSSLPDSYKNHEGCFTGYELLKPAVTYMPRDPYLRLSLREYIKNCIVPTILAGDISRYDLVNSRDVWNDVFPCTAGKLCAALTTVYYDSTYPDGIIETCPNAYARIDADMASEYATAYGYIKNAVFGTGSAVAESDIPVYLAEASSFLMAVGMTGDNLIRQAITIQSLNQVSAEFATAVAYQEAYLGALARINMLDFGRGGTLNAMKGVIETILVGLTPAFVLMFLTPMGKRIFYGWVTFFGWLVMWSIAEVVVVSYLFLSIGSNNPFDFTLSDIDRMVFTFDKAAQLSSLASDWIPILTFVIISGSLYAMTHFATGMSRELRDEHGAKVMASGNFDAGNIRARGYADLTTAIANSSVATTSMHTVTANTQNINSTAYDEQKAGTRQGIFQAPGGLTIAGHSYQKGSELIVTSGYLATGNKNLHFQNVKIDEAGRFVPIGGNSQIGFASGKDLKYLLGKLENTEMAHRAMGWMRENNLKFNEIAGGSVRFTDEGMVLNFVKDDGSRWEVGITRDGGVSGEVTYGGARLAFTDAGVRGISTPVKTTLSQAVREMGQRARAVRSYINRLEQNSEQWSESERFVRASALQDFMDRKISSEELEQVWRNAKEITNLFELGADGRLQIGKGGRIAGVPVKFLESLTSKMKKIPTLSTNPSASVRGRSGASLGATSRKSYGSEGRVGTSEAVGDRATAGESYDRAFALAASQMLSSVKSRAESLEDMWSLAETNEASLARDIAPEIAERYVQERGIDYGDALRELSEGNWKTFEDVARKYFRDEGFLQEILKDIRNRTEGGTPKEHLNVKAPGDTDVRDRVQEEIGQGRGLEGEVTNRMEAGGRDIEEAKETGRSIGEEIENSYENRRNMALGVTAFDALISMLGVKTFVGGDEDSVRPKGKLPPGPVKGELPPGDRGTPPAKPPSGGGGSMELDDFYKQASRFGITREEADRLLEIHRELNAKRAQGTLTPEEARKLTAEAEEIFSRGLNRIPPEAREEILGRMRQAEEVVARRTGREAAESIIRGAGKKLPLLGLAMAVGFAKERYEQGDIQGAALELVSGTLSLVPGIGTAGSVAVDSYLMARDLAQMSGMNIDREFDSLLRAEAISQTDFQSTDELKRVVWEDPTNREVVLQRMAEDPSYSLSLQGRSVRLDEKGNIYDYEALAQGGWSVNTQGQIYRADTGEMVRGANADDFRLDVRLG